MPACSHMYVQAMEAGLGMQLAKLLPSPTHCPNLAALLDTLPEPDITPLPEVPAGLDLQRVDSHPDSCEQAARSTHSAGLRSCKTGAVPLKRDSGASMASPGGATGRRNSRAAVASAATAAASAVAAATVAEAQGAEGSDADGDEYKPDLSQLGASLEHWRSLLRNPAEPPHEPATLAAVAQCLAAVLSADQREEWLEAELLHEPPGGFRCNASWIVS